MGDARSLEVETQTTPVKKPAGLNAESKPRKLSSPSLAKPTLSQEVDDTMKSEDFERHKKLVDKLSPMSDTELQAYKKRMSQGEPLKHIGELTDKILKPGTIKKAISYAIRGLGV